jgi:hypothetical protein
MATGVIRAECGASSYLRQSPFAATGVRDNASTLEPGEVGRAAAGVTAIVVAAAETAIRAARADRRTRRVCRSFAVTRVAVDYLRRVSLFRKIFGGGPPEEYIAATTDPVTLFHGAGIPMTGRVEHIHSRIVVWGERLRWRPTSSR